MDHHLSLPLMSWLLTTFCTSLSMARSLIKLFASIPINCQICSWWSLWSLRKNKAMVSLLFIIYIQNATSPRWSRVLPLKRGTTPLDAVTGQIVSQLGLGLQPSGDSAASYLHFYVATINNLAYFKSYLATFRAYSRGKEDKSSTYGLQWRGERSVIRDGSKLLLSILSISHI